MLAYVFVELKGPLGSAGEAKLQNLTACYLGLRLHFHLAKLAKNADPDNFKSPSEAISYSYGLRTGGGGSHWTLVAMKAAANSGVAGDLEVTRFVGVRGTQKGMLLTISPPTCSSVRLFAESYSPGRTPVRLFIVTVLSFRLSPRSGPATCWIQQQFSASYSSSKQSGTSRKSASNSSATGFIAFGIVLWIRRRSRRIAARDPGKRPRRVRDLPLPNDPAVRRISALMREKDKVVKEAVTGATSRTEQPRRTPRPASMRKASTGR